MDALAAIVREMVAFSREGGSVEFGALLRNLRRRALLSQERLAELSGLATRTVRDLERGRTERPRGDTVRLLADALQLRGETRAAFEAVGGGEPVPAGPAPPLSQLPPDVADFTGRAAEAAALGAWLAAEPETGIAIALVTGRAGVGKTALAVHVAHRLRDRFPDGQLFLNLGGVGGRAVSAGDALLRALRSLGVPGGAVPDEVEERAALYRAHLAGRSVLVLIDNAADEAQVRALLPGAGRSAALVTSRGVLAGLEAGHRLPLSELEPERSVELLARVAGAGRVEVDPEPARAIVELCGMLPLAVRIAGARLATEPGLSPDRLASRLADEYRRLDELRAGDLAVRTSFNASYRALDGDVREVFCALGLLNASDFPAWVPATVANRTVPDAERLLDRLVDGNLLDAAGADAAGRRRYRLHDLLAAFARERLEEERSATPRQVGLGRWLDAYLSVADWIEARLPEGGGRSPVPASAWLAPEHVELVTPVGERDEAGTGWAVACALVAFSFELRAHWDGWADTHLVAGLAARRGGDRLAPADGSDRLVVTVGDRSQWASVADRMATCVAVFRELGERRWEGVSLLVLGNLRRAEGLLDESAETLEACAALFRAEGARNWEVAAQFGLAGVEAARGCLERAEAGYGACLERFRGAGDRTWEAYTLRALGYAYQQHGRHEAAVRCLAACVPVFREVGDRLWEGHTELTLAYAERGRGRLPASAAHAAAAEAILRELGDTRGVAMALRARAAAALGRGRHEEALAAAEGAVAAFRELGDPIGAARSTQGLARAQRALGRTGEAAAHLRACLAVYRQLGLEAWEAEAQQELG
jgi:transcriptional regulator with XRE-family HTH domain/tetratricopeptide (TPR) repeat protein